MSLHNVTVFTDLYYTSTGSKVARNTSRTRSHASLSRIRTDGVPPHHPTSLIQAVYIWDSWSLQINSVKLTHSSFGCQLSSRNLNFFTPLHVKTQCCLHILIYAILLVLSTQSSTLQQKIKPTTQYTSNYIKMSSWVATTCDNQYSTFTTAHMLPLFSYNKSNFLMMKGLHSCKFCVRCENIQ